MNSDDVVYLALLFFSIGFGYFYRKIPDKNQKRNIGTIVGVLITLIVSGFHVAHTVVTLLINAVIILHTPRKHCHLVSLVFSFTYLLFFRTTVYFGVPYPPPHTNLIQMMLTLKLVGLAFEVNSRDEKDQSEAINPNFMDIVHYAFNYIGVLTGPYYRYRTFTDFINLPFSNYSNYKLETLNKLKYIPLFAGLYLWGDYNWPISYALTDEFYDRSWLYRYWYIWPNFFIFRMRIYTGLVLSECVCTMAGLGAYPTFTNPKPGQGPSEKFHEMAQLTSDFEKIEYNSETVHNVKPYGADFCTTYREAMKNWNICIQYWLAVYIYKRFPSKKYRTAVTMLVSSYWHGVYLGYYVCIGTAPLFLIIDDIYYKLIIKDNNSKYKILLEWIHWFFRMHFFSYQTIAFLLLDVNKIFHYYNSIYHAGLILWLVLLVTGMQLLKAKKTKARNTLKEQ